MRQLWWQISFSFVPLFLLLLATLVIPHPIQAAAAGGSKNFYNVLGLSRDCSSADIKKAYRKQCLQHHPDKGGSEEKFKEISSAYDVLSDESKRKLYDQYGEAAVDGNGMNVPPHAHAHQQPSNSFFSSFSSSTSRGGQPQAGAGFPFGTRGVDDTGFDMNDLFQGATSQNPGGLNLDLSELLSQLTGQAGGRNRFRQQQQQQRQQRTYERDCPCTLEELANGATKKMKVNFPKLGSKVYTIELKKGCKQGTKFDFPASKDGRFPPITFIIQEKKHPLFQRRGDDLIHRYDLSQHKNASSSGIVKVELTLLDGKLWTRSLAPNSSFLRAGQTLEITGKGMPIKGGPKRGDIIIEFYDSSQMKRTKQASG